MSGLRAAFPALVSVFVVVGCVLLFAEMMIGGHDRGEGRIGIIFAIIGVVVSGVSAAVVVFRVRIPAMVRVVVAAAWLAVSVGGLIGTWDHVRGEGEGDDREGGEEASITTSAPGWLSAAAEREDEGGDGERGGADGERPPLAPLSFTGLGLLGALAFVLGTEPDAAAGRSHDAEPEPWTDPD